MKDYAIQPDDPLVDVARKTYKMELSEFSEHIGVSENTLKPWRKNLPPYGKAMLEALIENYELKEKIKVIDDFKKLLSE